MDEKAPRTITAQAPAVEVTHLSKVFAREGLASRAELAGLVAADRVRLVGRGSKRAAERPRGS